MKRIAPRKHSILVATGCIFLAFGCGKSGPELGEVTGKITLNKQPLANATVEFIPESGRPSVGTTDANGQYVLHYTGDRTGAVLGTHTVRITTEIAGFEGEGGEAGQEAQEERVPPQYNRSSELTREVEPGSNTFDFDLESDGGTYPGIEEGGESPRQEA